MGAAQSALVASYSVGINDSPAGHDKTAGLKQQAQMNTQRRSFSRHVRLRHSCWWLSTRCQAGGVRGLLDHVIYDVGELLRHGYDLVFLQGLGSHKSGAHVDVQEPRPVE